MAYYLIHYDNKTYANRALVKTALGIGDAGIARLIASHDLTVEMLLAEPVYHLSDALARNFLRGKKLGGMVCTQDLGMSIASAREELATREPDESDLRTYYPLGGIDFVRLMDTPDPNRYRRARMEICMRVCGTIYIARRISRTR